MGRIFCWGFVLLLPFEHHIQLEWEKCHPHFSAGVMEQLETAHANAPWLAGVCWSHSQEGERWERAPGRARDLWWGTPMPVPSACFSLVVLHHGQLWHGISILPTKDAQRAQGLESYGFQRKGLSCLGAMRWMRPGSEDKMLHTKLHASEVKERCQAVTKVRTAKNGNSVMMEHGNTYTHIHIHVCIK